MQTKPRSPYPLLVMAILRRMLPAHLYRRYVGRHDDESRRLWIQNANKVPADKAILDIGAFHGDYSLSARAVNPKSTIFAFEPNPYTLPVLLAACDRADVVVLPLAVAEENGSLPFVCSEEESSLVGAAAVAAAPQKQVPHVEAVTLDSWTTKRVVSPSLIKIDVEGAEAGILRSSQRVLNECQPIILCEVLTDAAGTEVMAALPKAYRFFYIDENGGTKEERRITRRRWRDMNWLLVPEHRVAQCCK